MGQGRVVDTVDCTPEEGRTGVEQLEEEGQEGKG